MGDPSGDVVRRFMMGTESGDFESISDLVHDDFVMYWPQSGERFVGRDNAFGAMQVQEIRPRMAGEPRLIGSGEVWVMMVPLNYDEDLFHYVAVLELQDGRLKRATGYWGSPFPAQKSRARFAEGASS